MNENTPPSAPDWADLPLFLAIARLGSLSAAAKATGKSPATLGRRMHALERRLGRELLIRHGRGYDLTEDGAHFAEELKGIDAQIGRLTAPPETDTLPLVKLSAGSWTSLDLVKRMAHILGDPPAFRLRLVATEDMLSLTQRDIAIGIRANRPTEAGLAGRILRRVYFAPYALERYEQRWLNTTLETPSARYVAERIGPRVHLETSSARSLLDMALAGIGKAMLPSFVAGHYPQLVRAGPMVPDLSHDQWLVTQDEERHHPAQRLAIDRITAAIAMRD